MTETSTLYGKYDINNHFPKLIYSKPLGLKTKSRACLWSPKLADDIGEIASISIEANVLTLVVGDKRLNIPIYIFQLSIWGDRGYSPIQIH